MSHKFQRSVESLSVTDSEIILTPKSSLRKTLREGVKKNVFIWDFVSNIGPHPPTAHVWDSTK